MQTNSKLWESKVLIRFSDCDPFNHLNNARYIDYFINAREDHVLANMNFNIYHFAAEYGLGWVVSKTQVVYLKPAVLMKTVVIDSVILRVGATGLLVEMKMWNERKDKLKSVMWTNLVHINIKTQKPENHSQHLLDLFKPIEDPIDIHLNFDDRVNQLRNV